MHNAHFLIYNPILQTYVYQFSIPKVQGIFKYVNKCIYSILSMK